MNAKQREAARCLVNAAISFNQLEDIRVSIALGQPDQEHRYYFHIKGRWPGRADTGQVATQEHGNHQHLHYDEMLEVLAHARNKVARLQDEHRREYNQQEARFARQQPVTNTPYAYWQPINDAIHAPKDNHKLRVFEATLRQHLKYFDPCQPIELVRDGIHYSAKKKPPPHLFIRGKELNQQDPEATYCWDPISSFVLDHRMDNYEEVYAIVEAVLSEFRRVGLVKAILRGIDCNPKGLL